MIHKGGKNHTHLQRTGKATNTGCASARVTPVVFSLIDQQQLDEEIKALRKGLKEKVNRLNEIQGASWSVDSWDYGKSSNQMCMCMMQSYVLGTCIYIVFFYR